MTTLIKIVAHVIDPMSIFRYDLVTWCFAPSKPQRLHPGWKRKSIHHLVIPHKSHKSAKFFKHHKISLDKQNIQTSKTNFRRNSGSDITLVEKAHKGRTCWYRLVSYGAFRYEKVFACTAHTKIFVHIKDPSFNIIIIIIIINPLTARVVGAPQMILQPVFSFFPCSPLPSGTCRTPGLSIPSCCLPTSSYVCLVSWLTMWWKQATMRTAHARFLSDTTHWPYLLILRQ